MKRSVTGPATDLKLIDITVRCSFFFALQHQYIQERHRADPEKRDQPLPMSGDAKRQRFEFREAAAKKERSREGRDAPAAAARDSKQPPG